jgi:hypothetical protein
MTFIELMTDQEAGEPAAGLFAEDRAAMGYVALAAAARCFFSTVLDAMGTQPDAAYRTGLEPDLRRALTVGRPIADGR